MKKWIAIITILAIIGFWASKKVFKHENPKEKSSLTKVEAATYWTCPMHPQVHMDHPGECPICHMKLVQVKAQQAQTAANNQSENRSVVQVTNDQLNLIGIQRYEVEKMTLKVHIPVSGRFISASTVAFQIYESDLRYIRPGLSFEGKSSFFPEIKIVGVVSSVDSIVDPTSRTVRVVGSVKQGPRGAASETGFRGDIDLELKDRVAIPESSVVHTGTNDLVYLFGENNQVTAKPVTLGIKAEGFYDVLEGLTPGEFISSGPNFLIDSEAKIRGAQ